jgi:hypothetical protein
MMRIIYLLAVCGLLLLGCSEKQTEPAAQTKAENASENQPSPATQEAQPTQEAQADSSDPYQLPKTGKVLKAMHAGGYTYMEVENHGKRFWIATTMMNVQRNDHISWSDAAVMKNFTSSTLRKTFDEILFVTAAQAE